MFRIRVWRRLLLLILYYACLHCSEASVSVIERDIEPIVFVTSASTSSTTDPLYLVLPLLLDVQPALLKLDVTRHVPAQVQSFCREHGMESTRCTGAIRQALDRVTNFQRFCKEPAAGSALPGFAVARNIIRESGEASSASWLQNDPQDVTMDFCAFAQAKEGEGSKENESDKCIAALGEALSRSFDWMLALAPCEQGAPSVGEEVGLLESVAPSFVDRLATVEGMIAELQSSSVDEDDIGATMLEEEHLEGINASSIGENSEAQEQPTQDNIVDSDENVGESLEERERSDVTISDREAVGEQHDQVNTSQNATSISDLTAETLADNGEQMNSDPEDPANELVEPVDDSHLEKLDDVNIVESETMEAANDSCEATYKTQQTEEWSLIGESQRTWKVGAALVLILLILYLAIDLVIQGVHYMASHLGATNQRGNIRVHDMLHLVHGGPPLKHSYASRSDDLKKPMLRRSQVSPLRKRAESDVVDASHHSSPSFACAAMMLMANHHAPIRNNRFSLSQTTFMQQKLPISSLAQDGNEALNIIQQNYERELAAVQRIQRAWRASQRKRLLKKKWENVFNAAIAESLRAPDSRTPVFRSLQRRNTDTVLTRQAVNGAPSLRRLVPTALPPL